MTKDTTNKAIFNTMLSDLQKLAPSDALCCGCLDTVTTETQKQSSSQKNSDKKISTRTLKGTVRLKSHQGLFCAESQSDNIEEIVNELHEQISTRLEIWKGQRSFKTSPQFKTPKQNEHQVIDLEARRPADQQFDCNKSACPLKSCSSSDILSDQERPHCSEVHSFEREI